APDIARGAVALAAAAPVRLTIALTSRLTSRGPVLLRQERMGLDGRAFTMLKFRTMRVDAETESGPVWTRADDPRRTPIGAWLRHFSLAELPQLVNVLRGGMSLVGPRPDRPRCVEGVRGTLPGSGVRP